MNENYLIFNYLGILTESDLKQVSQGNHNVDYFYIGYHTYDYTNSYLTVAITLPNGVELPELATSQKDFEFEGYNYRGYMFKFLEPITAIAGNLTMTFVLKNMEDDTELFSSQLNITIHETDNHVEPTITELQYNEMQEVIREEFNEIDRKIQSGTLKGDKGDKGDVGERGFAGTITIGTVKSVESYEPAKVTNVGTPTEAVLDFEIPKGEFGGATKTSDLKNDGDGNSPFATQKYVKENGGKIDSISVNGVKQPINNKNVNVEVPNIDGLATVEFVNSSIATNTATFRGTYNSVNELPKTGVDINDYAFVINTDENGNKIYDRYKFTTKWEFEYQLNNSSFTKTQWDAIQSGITSTKVEQIQENTNNINKKVDKQQSVNDANKYLYINQSGEVDTTPIKTKLGEFENDTNFVTKSASNLTNYYTKSQSDSSYYHTITTTTEEIVDVNGSRTEISIQRGDKNGTLTGVNFEIYEYEDAIGDPTDVVFFGKSGLMSAKDKIKLDSLVELYSSEIDEILES